MYKHSTLMTVYTDTPLDDVLVEGSVACELYSMFAKLAKTDLCPS